MSELVEGDPRRGAYFVTEFGLGVGELGYSTLTSEPWTFSNAETLQGLIDVTVLAQVLVQEVAVLTGEHELDILGRIERDGTPPPVEWESDEPVTDLDPDD